MYSLLRVSLYKIQIYIYHIGWEPSLAWKIIFPIKYWGKLVNRDIKQREWHPNRDYYVIFIIYIYLSNLIFSKKLPRSVPRPPLFLFPWWRMFTRSSARGIRNAPHHLLRTHLRCRRLKMILQAWTLDKYYLMLIMTVKYIK